MPTKKLVLSAMVGATIAFPGTLTSATASPITYNLVGVSLDFGSFGTDNLSGSFTFDPSTITLDEVNIVVSGSLDPSTYNIPFSASTNGIGALDGTLLGLGFSSDLGLSSDPLAGASFGGRIGLKVTEAILTAGVTGEADPTPLPAALPLFATGIGGLGLLGWRRKRKARVVLA